MTLQGKVAIVTGSSRGIGCAVALAFAARGAKVLVNSSTDVAGGRDVRTTIASEGGTAHYVQADVSDPRQVVRMFDETKTVLGPVDILVNNAGDLLMNNGRGRARGASLAESTEECWIHTLKVNLLSTVACSMCAAGMMADRGGSIINTSSAINSETVTWLTNGLDANSQESLLAYSAAKAAVNDFTRTLAKQLAPAVRVNAVAPGFVATSRAMSDTDRLDEDRKQSWMNHIPLRQAIDPAEIAGSYVYLAESAYLTGTILTADAGITLREG